MKDPEAHNIPAEFVSLWKEAVEKNNKAPASKFINIMTNDLTVAVLFSKLLNLIVTVLFPKLLNLCRT